MRETNITKWETKLWPMSTEDMVRSHAGLRWWGKLDEDFMQREGIDYTPGSETYFIQDPYGLRIPVEVTGDPEGYPAFLCAGTPSGRRGPKPDTATLMRLGVRLFAWDRRAYGYASAACSHWLWDEVDKIHTIAQYFGLKEYGVVGRSGGAVYALAAAAVLKAVKKAALIVPMAPLYEMGESWFDGMGEHNTEFFRGLAQELPTIEDPYAPYKDPRAAQWSDLAKWRERINQREAELRHQPHVLGDPNDPYNGIHDPSLAAHVSALKFGSVGRMIDLLGCLYWPFDPHEVQKPTLIWAAEQDIYTPRSHAEWLARCIGENAILHIEPNSEHFDGVDATAIGIEWCASRD